MPEGDELDLTELALHALPTLDTDEPIHLSTLASYSPITMVSPDSRALPHLPLETQAAILRFCDPSTLAASSRVCLAWLELAGPILYEHITIKGREQLDLLISLEVQASDRASDRVRQSDGADSSDRHNNRTRCPPSRRSSRSSRRRHSPTRCRAQTPSTPGTT